MRVNKVIILSLILMFSFANFVWGESIKERFEGRDRLTYEVSFNGMPSGKVEWQYLGRQTLNGKEVDILFINSDTKILKIINLESKEKVFIDSQTRLPLKVERDLVFFGKKELIEENYNQEEGQVKIIWRLPVNKEQVFYPDPPIYNILGLLYFFPKHIALEDGKLVMFNLPTTKVKIKMVEDRKLDVNGEKKEAYFLMGSGGKRFNLWLDKENRLPLRLEFILPVGKIIITRKE